MKTTPPTEQQIQARLYLRFHGILMVPNSCVLGWESDFIVITKALLIHEFEIKRTRADFQNDKHKERTSFMERWINGERTFQPWGGHSYTVPIPKPANYFWYVCPKGLVKPEELPPYAGLMEVDDAGTIRTVHQTKRIHREKLEVKSILQVSSSVNVRYWNYRLKEVWSVA